jgi:hypothetical protein
MLIILSQIIAAAYAGALDSQALNAVCAVGHRTDDRDLRWTLETAHSATTQAIAVALRPFGMTPDDVVETYTDHAGNERTSDAATRLRVYGSSMLAEARRF